MDLMSIIGLVLGFGMIMGAFVMEGGDPAGLLQITAVMIIFGGSFAVILIGFPLSEITRALGMIKMIFTEKKVDEIAIINQMVDFAEKARREGILSLEQYVHTDLHPLFAKGLGLAVDGIEGEVIKEILSRESALYEHQYHAAAEVYESLGGASPTMGVVGTVLGLISVLSNLSDPSSLGPKIALAFIATFMGVFAANILWLPFANKLKVKGKRDKEVNEIIIEGILSIQAGENPRIIKDKLNLELLQKLH